MQPGVEEHASVAGGEDEAVAVEPFRVFWIEVEADSEEDGADFSVT